MNVTRSQSGEDRKGACGKGQPYHTCVPGHLGGLLMVCLEGVLSQQESAKFKILQYIPGEHEPV